MARNEEKAQSLLNRWTSMKQDFSDTFKECVAKPICTCKLRTNSLRLTVDMMYFVLCILLQSPPVPSVPVR